MSNFNTEEEAEPIDSTSDKEIVGIFSIEEVNALGDRHNLAIINANIAGKFIDIKGINATSCAIIVTVYI